MIERITPRKTALFLFNYSKREMYGVFESQAPDRNPDPNPNPNSNLNPDPTLTLTPPLTCTGPTPG